MNLLIISEETNNAINGHYVYIKNFNGLLTSQNSDHKRYYCPICLNSFMTQKKLNEHKIDCSNKP